jgi:transcriptional regulator with XRE-family HTH domain
MRCQASADLGDVLRAVREEQGLSQRRLAVRAGTSQDAISRIERGVEAPTLERFERLMLSMGLRLVIDVEPLESQISPADLAVSARMSPAERLREAASWNRLASEAAIAGERARQKGHPATRGSEEQSPN